MTERATASGNPTPRNIMTEDDEVMTGPSALDVLKQARALIDTPEKWTRGTYARYANGEEARPTSASAVCYCGMGAIARVLGAFWNGEAERSDAARLLYRANAFFGCSDFIDFNDAEDTTHADVLAAFDRAIELASREAAVSKLDSPDTPSVKG